MVDAHHLVEACWRSPIFGDSYNSSVAYKEIERIVGERERAFIASFTPIIASGMLELSTEVRDDFIRAMSGPVVGLFLSIGVELGDLDRLTRACIHYGLSYWGNAFLDRGDPAMEAAVRALLKEHNAFPEGDNLAGQESLESEPFDTRQTAEGPSTAVRTRLDALREIAPQVAYLCRPDDASVLLHERSFQLLKHSLGVYQLTRLYMKGGKSGFWEKHAFQYVKHLILSNSLFGYIGLFYGMYRRERPDLPSLIEIMEVQPLMRFVEGLANAATRIFDDAGDQEIDAGRIQPHIAIAGDKEDSPARASSDARGREHRHGVSQLKHVSLFNTPDPILIRAFFHFIGINDKALVEQAIKALNMQNREGDSTILQLYVDLLRKQMKELPAEILTRYRVFITLLKRAIECGYVNLAGEIAYSDYTTIDSKNC
jgi:hypothetical protein